jgi:hypothetical protein
MPWIVVRDNLPGADGSSSIKPSPRIDLTLGLVSLWRARRTERRRRKDNSIDIRFHLVQFVRGRFWKPCIDPSVSLGVVSLSNHRLSTR